MNPIDRWTRPLALASVAMLLAIAAAPIASAQSQLNVRSVGEIFVDAQGRASGQNIATTITEAQGTLTGFASLALGAAIFDEVAIDGFEAAGKIQGVGSSSLLLTGSNAVVTIHDNINSVLQVRTTAATTVTYRLAGDVHATQDGALKGVVHLKDDSGAYLGSLVAAGADAAGNAESTVFFLAEGEVRARAEEGSRLVFVGQPVYLGSEGYQDAVVDAAAKGTLAAQFVTDFEGSSVASSQVDHASDVIVKTRTTASGAVHTDVRSRAEASAMIAYDLAYETLPARDADDVAVYADGQLAARAETAAQVAAFAEAGIASYYAFVHNGRAQILASTPDFQTLAEHRMTVTSSAQASTEAQAQAEQRSRSDSRAYGDFEHHANGKLTGEFLTSVVAQGRAALYSFTTLDSRTEVFQQVEVVGAADSHLRSDDGHTFTVDSPQADLVLVDDAHATMIAEAKARADVAYDLAADVRAEQRADDVVTLYGPNGYAGALILTSADASAKAKSSLKAQAEGRVDAALATGASVVYRASAEADASEEAVVDAIASAKVGAQVLAGIQADAIAAVATSYHAEVVAEAEAKARGALEVEYTSYIESAQSFVVDARGTSLAAKAASDVHVLVNGQAAVPTATAEAVLEASAYAKYYAATNIDGSLRILVNTAAEAGATSHVLVESKIDAAARAAAHADAFGSFKVFYDGTAVGSFVTLKAQQTAGAVSDFTMLSTGETIFSSISAGASGFTSGGADGSSVLVLENREAVMEFSDTTTAFMKTAAKVETQVAFALAAGLEAHERASGVIELTDSAGAHVGSMIVTSANAQAAAASSLKADAEGNIRAHLEQGAQVLFRTHAGIEAELSAAQRTMINTAIASGQVAGQVLVQTQATAAANAHAAAAAAARLEATARASADASADVVAVGAAEAYGRVTTTVTASYDGTVDMVTAATKERVDVTVSSVSEVGKTIIISLDPATVSGMARGDAVILFDGHLAQQASSYADILDANNDAGVAEYFVLAGEAGTQVLVSVPHFSVHTVTLQERSATSGPVFMYATIALGLLLAVETVVLVRRRTA